MRRLLLLTFVWLLPKVYAGALPCQFFKIDINLSSQRRDPCDLSTMISIKNLESRFDRQINSTQSKNKFLQKRFRTISGISVLSFRSEVSPSILEALILIYRTDLGRVLSRRVNKLRYILSLDSLSQNKAFGLYLESIDSIVLPESLASRSTDEIFETLAHEIGHATLFSLINPEEFKKIAVRLGGWNLYPTKNLYDRQFLTNFSGVSVHSNTFPTTYSYASTHEWFAENFAHYILEKLGKNNRLSRKMKLYFDDLLF